MQKLTASQLCESQQTKYYEALLNMDIPSNHVILKMADGRIDGCFGNARKRKGQCVKLGYTHKHQIWLSWAFCDIHAGHLQKQSLKRFIQARPSMILDTHEDNRIAAYTTRGRALLWCLIHNQDGQRYVVRDSPNTF